MVKNTSTKKDSSTKTVSGAVTMADLLKKYEGALQTFEVGDKVKGKVTELQLNRVVINIGGKSEGIVAEKAFKESENYIKTLKIGDEVEGVVIVTENPEGYAVLSFRQSSQNALWDEVEKAMETGEPVSVYGKMATPSGIVVEYKATSGFLPKSQLGSDVSENPSSLVGKRFEAAIIDFDRDLQRIIFSEKEISEKEEIEKAKKALSKIKEKETYTGEVSAIYDFGIFVSIQVDTKSDTKVEGLVHISELSWDKVGYPGELYKVGDKVNVLVLGKDKGKLSLSIKQIADDPWKTVADRIKVDQKIKGSVTKSTDFGVFVALEPGIEGLIHMTKIPHGKKYDKGEEINVYVEEVDEKQKKISLGIVLTSVPVGYK